MCWGEPGDEEIAGASAWFSSGPLSAFGKKLYVPLISLWQDLVTLSTGRVRPACFRVLPAAFFVI